MPQLIEVPGQGTVEFPDNMTDEQIVAAIRGISAPRAASAAPAAPAAAPEPKTAGRILDDVVRSIASGVTFGFADELAAAATAATGLGAQKPGATSYETALAAERERNKEISPYVSIPGEIAGGIATGSALGRAGLTLLRPQMPLPASSMVARGAGEAAAYGALSGAGAGENLEERLVGAGLGAAIGAPLGAAGGALAARATKPAAPPSVADLETQGNTAYTAARQAGLMVKPETTANFADELYKSLKEFSYNPKLQPKVGAVIDEIENLSGKSYSPKSQAKPIMGIDDVEFAPGKAATLDDLENVRKVMREAAMSNDRSDRKLASKLISKYDELLSSIGKNDITAGDLRVAIPALESARSIWARKSKGEVIERLLARAENSAPAYSASGLENAIRSQFRNLANNEKRMRGFSKEEQAAIEDVAKGSLTDNALRFLGRFAPRGPVGTGFAGGFGALLGGGPGAAAVLGVGELGRQAATAATIARAQRAAEMMRAGGPMQRRQLTPAEMLRLRAAPAAAGAAVPTGLLREEE